MELDLDWALSALPEWQRLGWRKLREVQQELGRLRGQRIVDLSRIGGTLDVDVELDKFQESSGRKDGLLWDLPHMLVVKTETYEVALYHFLILLTTIIHWSPTPTLLQAMMKKKLVGSSRKVSLSGYPSAGDEYLRGLIGKKITSVELITVRHDFRPVDQYDAHCGLHLATETGAGLCFGTFFTGFGERRMWKTDLMADTELVPEMIEEKVILLSDR